MNSRIIHRLSLPILMFLILCCVSCDEGPFYDEDKIKARFTIPGTMEVEGEKIEVNNILLVNDDKKIIKVLDNVVKEGGRCYISVDRDMLKSVSELYFLARQKADIELGKQINKDGPLFKRPENKYCIPLVGHKSFSKGDIAKGYVNLGEVSLLRSASVINFSIDSEDELTKDYAIDKISCNVSQEYGFLMPGGWEEKKYFNEYMSDLANVEVSIVDKKKKKASFVMLDFDNKDDRLEFTVEMSRGEDKITEKLHLRKSGKPVNVVRGNEYNCNLRLASGKFVATIDVKPWDIGSDITLDYDNEFALDKELEWTEGYESVNIDEKKLCLKKYTRAIGEFKLTAPRGTIWYAVLRNIDGAAGKIKFWDGEKDEAVNMVSGVVSEQQKMDKIQIFFEGYPGRKTSSAELMIFARMGSKTIHVTGKDKKNWKIYMKGKI